MKRCPGAEVSECAIDSERVQRCELLTCRREVLELSQGAQRWTTDFRERWLRRNRAGLRRPWAAGFPACRRFGNPARQVQHELLEHCNAIHLPTFRSRAWSTSSGPANECRGWAIRVAPAEERWASVLQRATCAVLSGNSGRCRLVPGRCGRRPLRGKDLHRSCSHG